MCCIYDGTDPCYQPQLRSAPLWHAPVDYPSYASAESKTYPAASAYWDARQARTPVDLGLIAHIGSPTVPKDMISYANAPTRSGRWDRILGISISRVRRRRPNPVSLSSESVVPDDWSAVRSTRILLSYLNHIGRVIDMSLGIGKLPHNPGIQFIQDADVVFDDAKPPHGRI